MVQAPIDSNRSVVVNAKVVFTESEKLCASEDIFFKIFVLSCIENRRKTFNRVSANVSKLLLKDCIIRCWFEALMKVENLLSFTCKTHVFICYTVFVPDITHISSSRKKKKKRKAGRHHTDD